MVSLGFEILSSRQKQLIRLTWDDDFMSLFHLGCDIYAQLFILDPSLTKHFPKLPTKLIGIQWRENPDCRTQGLKFVQILANAVQNLDNLKNTKFVSELRNLGERHQRHITQPFSHHHWNIFEKAIELCTMNQMKSRQILDESDILEAAVGWRNLSHFITLTIREGFEGADNTLNHKSSIGCTACLCFNQTNSLTD